MSRVSLDDYEPMDPSCQQDPFPYYAALREQAPVYRSPKSGIYFVGSPDEPLAARDPCLQRYLA